MNSTKRMPTYFISHGGGPWPWLEGKFQEYMKELRRSLESLPGELPEKPKAILIISGHWEEDKFAIMTNPMPGMEYDYSGFPAFTYEIKYPAHGSPELAARVKKLLDEAGIDSKFDPSRGYDHGIFAPLAVSYPNADVPVVALSIRNDYDPAAHLELGRALAPLRDEGVLIIGSGLSYHNLRMFNEHAIKPSREFDEWLNETLINSSTSERSEKLLHWGKAPSARLAHPQEDHLIPLMVAVGAAEGEAAALCYHEEKFMGGITVSSFRFGDAF
jgi:aromatic ring-opening dioxygenase catalytic subunit (LigB family)